MSEMKRSKRGKGVKAVLDIPIAPETIVVPEIPNVETSSTSTPIEATLESKTVIDEVVSSEIPKSESVVPQVINQAAPSSLLVNVDSMTDKEVKKHFTIICDFVNELKEFFGSTRKGLKMYATLLGNIQIKHVDSMKLHTKRFFDYCLKHRASIIAEDIGEMGKILHTTKIVIDLKDILSSAKTTEKNTIWKYLLTILYGATRDVEVRGLLESNGPEGEFVKDMFSKISESASGIDGSDPQAAMMGLLSGGFISDIMKSAQSGINGGQMDVRKLMGTVRGLINALDPEGADDKDMKKNAANILKSIDIKPNTLATGSSESSAPTTPSEFDQKMTADVERDIKRIINGSIAAGKL